MYQDVILPDIATQRDLKQISSLIETAETIRDNALNLARMKMLPRERDMELAKLMKRRDFAEYFKFSLAQEVAQVVATYDQHVKKVYIFEESANPDAETEEYLPFVDLTIHLLALVTSTSAALESFILSLDRTLTKVLIELPDTEFAKRTSFLEILPVTEADVEHGQGSGKLLSAIYARPIKIWERA